MTDDNGDRWICCRLRGDADGMIHVMEIPRKGDWIQILSKDEDGGCVTVQVIHVKHVVVRKPKLHVPILRVEKIGAGDANETTQGNKNED